MNGTTLVFEPPPTLVWGLVSRGIGTVFLISFLSLSFQVISIAGRAGVVPVHDALRAIERDFPTWRRYVYFPTLLWLDRSDTTLRLLTWAGIAASTAIIIGGPYTAAAFLVCYVAYLSLDRAVHLVYPWDCMLFEAGFWGMFLPATLVLPALNAATPPDPAIAWVYRLLVFRVILGFGKHKFLGSTSDDTGFLKSFMAGQPLPTLPGWLSHHLPMWVLKLSLIVMFIVEIPLPFAVFFPGALSTIAALGIIALMVAIQVTGNFGYFNLLTIVVALSWLDNETAARFDFGMLVPSGPLDVHLFVIAHTILAILCFPFNTFCAHTWMNWTVMLRTRPRWLTYLLYLPRIVHPFRIAHAYGVFPPQNQPGIKLSPVTEATWDDVTWHTLTYRHFPTLETSKPTVCAPHHDRIEQAIVYEGIGLNEQSYFRNGVGRWDPYGHGGVPAPLTMLHQLVSGRLLPGFVDRSREKAHGPPRRARVRLYMFEPTSIKEMRSSGRFWKKTLVGPHYPPLRATDSDFEQENPPPELWHFEDLVWLERSRVGALMKRSAAGEDPHALVSIGLEGFEDGDIDRFWEDIVAVWVSRHREAWTGVRRSVEALRERYSASELKRFERLAGRYGALLLARIEPLFLDRGLSAVFGEGRTTLNVPSYFHLRLLTLHIVGEGKARYDAIMAKPDRAVALAPSLTMASGGAFFAVFRYEALVYQAQKFRLLDVLTEVGGRRPPSEKEERDKARGIAIAKRLFGALEFAEFLKTQFATEEDVLDVPECLPRFALDEQKAIVRVDG